MKELVSMRRTTLCFVIVIAGLYGLLYFDIASPLFVIIAGCIVLCIASMYFLFNAYVIYISEKILRLYNKPNGEYVIIPNNSKWLFWLYLFYNPYIWEIGIKAKKNGNFLELSGIKEERFHWSTSPSIFRFIFFDNYNSCNSSHFDFNRFGFINYEPTGVILFTYDKGVWLFKLIHKDEDSHYECDDFNDAYENASKHSHNHLMKIYFSGMNLDYNESEEEKIFYNIITQTNENKIINKKIEEDRIIEYYYDDYKKDGHWWDPWLVIEKVTNIKEGFYFYNMRGNTYFLFDLNIKEFMQKNSIYPRGLFEFGNDKKLNYGSKCDGAMVYCLDGNYFMLQWDKDYASSSSNSMPHEYSSIYIKPITLEKYTKILEDDCKYQREKKNLEEKWRKIIYNIITQTGENEIIFDEKLYSHSDTKKFYYYREKCPGYDDKYSSISKRYGEYLIEGWEFENFRIEEFMQSNDIHYEKIYDSSEKYDYIDSYRLNENCFFHFRYESRDKHGPYSINYSFQQTLNNRGTSDAANGNFDSAIEYYNKALRIKPYYYDALNNRGVAYAAKGDFDRAIADYTEALRIKPDYYDALYNRSEAYHNKGDFDRALEDYNAILKIKPDYYINLYNYGRGTMYHYNNGFDRAIAYYNKALKIKPDYYEALYNRGAAYVAKGDFDNAIADYTEALKIKPDDYDALNNRCVAYYSKGDFDNAIADYTEAFKIKPNYYIALNYCDASYFDRRDFDNAIEDYNEALKVKPDDYDALNNRGTAYDDIGDFDRAIADYTEALRIKPDYYNALNNRGAVYYRKGDYDKAIADYTEALKIKPDYHIALYNRSDVYHAKGDFNRAIADYAEALRIKPDYYNTLNNRGTKYRFDLAIAYYNKALRIKPDCDYVLHNRGATYAGNGDFDLAIADYTEALRIKPDYYNAIYGRGLVYTAKGDFDRAIADYTEAIKINPDDYGALNDRGIAYSNKGDLDNAIADYTEALRIKPNDHIILYNRGVAYADKDDFDHAIADYTEALKIKPDDYDALSNRGVAYYRKGDYDRAIEDLEIVLKIDPDNVKAKEIFEKIRQEKGRKEEN